jgi:hypothetical protein
MVSKLWNPLNSWPDCSAILARNQADALDQLQRKVDDVARRGAQSNTQLHDVLESVRSLPETGAMVKEISEKVDQLVIGMSLISNGGWV